MTAALHVVPDEPTLSRSVQERLFGRWQAVGDEAARDRLVRHYLPFTYRLAHRYWGAWEPVDDLRQVASVGLLKAIDRYDTARGTSFKAFATPTILGELKRYFRDCGWSVRIPRGMKESALAVEKADHELSSDGRRVSMQLIAEYLEMPLEAVCAAAEAAQAHHSTSMDAEVQLQEGDVVTLGDRLGVRDAGYDRIDATATVARAALVLDEMQRQVVALRFGLDLSQAEIAARVGVSQMQISRILRRAIGLLAVEMESSAAEF